MTAQAADFARYFEKEIATKWQHTVEELGIEALAWLALPPIWTEELAALVPFPAKPLDRVTFLSKCEKIGWCVRRPIPIASRREDAAEILIYLIGILSGVTRETGTWDRAVNAAVSVIDQIEVPAVQRSLRDRLAELAGASAARDAGAERDTDAPAADATSAEPGPPDHAGQLVVRRAWAELEELLATARPAELQRIVLRHLDELPAMVLESSIKRIASACTPRVAARVLADSLPGLPRTSVRSLVTSIQPLVHPDQRGAEAAIANLAVAAGYGGDSGTALALCDRLSDDRLRARALGALAGVVARDQDRRLTRDIASRIARTVVDGEGVDLAGAADAVTQLAEADAVEFAGPIIAVVRDRLQRDRLTASDIGALVKLATSIRSASHDAPPDAGIFIETAVNLARALADPAARSAGLARVLPIVKETECAALAVGAMQAARAVADVTDRARALSRIVEYLEPDQLSGVVDEILVALQPADPGDAFWVPDGARADILAELERQRQLPWLRGQAAAIGQAVQELSRSRVVPPALRRWAALAATLTDEADEAGVKTGQTLLDEVTDLLGSGLMAEALGWIETGRRLRWVIRGAFDTSLLVAARKVELSQRTADDRRLLQRFLPRDKQLNAFRRLLTTEPGEPPWALHYLGGGGVGKTMLLRHISAELAPAKQLIVARVDFDHLNPDFLLRRPGLLLLAMLEELEVYASPATRELYEDAQKVLSYQEQPLSRSSSAVSVSLAVDYAIQRFCAYLQALDQRIVLILDTCEELAKFEPAGAVLPQVDAAFRLLERIHEELPSVLVVLAGRRPLARQVYHGHLRDARRPQSGIQLEKPYLMVQEVAGFTTREAQQYLSEMEGLTLGEGDARELLYRSRSGPHEPYYADGPDPAGTITHIPFDLAQYAAALRENPDYLRSASRNLAYATYVRDRIADRLMPNATRLLPTMVVMRRFDQDMLAVAVLDMRITSAEAWQELGAIEWITTHFDSVLRTTFMEIDRTMLERLQAFYAVDQLAEYNRARRLLADGLAGIVRRRPLTQLTVDHVDAALRCLEPAQAADLCDELSLRVAGGTQQWMWAYYVFSRVLGLDGALAEPDHLAAASATALHATALSQVKPTEDLRLQWNLIAAAAVNHPRQEIARWLASRAAILAAPADTDRWLDAIRLVKELLSGGREDQRRAAWLAGTVLAAISKITTTVRPDRELSAIAHRQWVLRELIRYSYSFAPHVLAVARVLLAHALLIADDVDGATAQFRLAIDIVGHQLSVDEAGEAAADGAIPGNIRDWVRLEAALADLPEIAQNPDVRREWLDQATDAIKASTSVGPGADPDSDRLAALLLGRLLDERLLPADRLSRIQDAVGTLPPPPARTQAHGSVPPLRIVLSRAWLAIADVSQARNALGPRGAFAETAAEQRTLDLTRVEIARRMRLPKSDPSVRRKLREECSLVEAPRVYEAMSLLGEGAPSEPETFRPPVHLHAWWHAEAAHGRVPGGYDSLDNAFIVARQWCAPDQPYLREALFLDHVELARRANKELPDGKLTQALRVTEHRRRWPPDSDEEVWRLGLRKAALAAGDIAAKSDNLPPGWPLAAILPGLPRPATRRLAELALDEGELLALRLPEPGARLLHMAREWFEEAGDPVGVLISHTAERLASARSTRRGPEPAELTELRDTYQNARDHVPGLPSWSSLEDEGRYAEAVSEMAKPTRTAWEGWLLRLRWLLEGAPETWRGLDPEITAIPPEFGIRQEKSPAKQASSRTPHGESQATRQVPDWLTVVSLRSGSQAVLIGIGALAAVLLGLGIGASANSTTATVGGLPVLWIFVSAGLIAVMTLVGFHVATTGPGKSWALVALDPGPTAASVVVRATAFASRRWRLRSKPEETELRVQMLRPTTPAPGKTAIHELLRDTAHPGRPLPVSLLVARSLVGVSWEAWLGAELGDVDLRFERPYRLLLQNVPESRSQPRDPAYWVMSPPRWRSLISKALPAGKVDFPPQFPAASPGDVLVIVAVAVNTAAGRRLVIHNGKSRHNDLVIDPDDAVLTDLTIVVVGEPRGERGRASAAQSVAALRVCAADLVEAGARTVVVVPNAPSVMASHVLACLTTTLRPGEYPSAKALTDTAARARDLLKTEVDPRLAYELTVMSRTPS
jgi:hypothetical protein